MPSYLALTVYLLDGTFHGRRDRGEPEWPPSPLRAVQSIVAAAAGRTGGGPVPHGTRSALEWLERQAPPMVLAPEARSSLPYVLSVPNNDMDAVARAWSRGEYFGTGDASPAAHRSFKTLRPMRLLADQPVSYVWELSDSMNEVTRQACETTATLARSVTALGLGIDMAVGYARVLTEEQARALPGERWLPTAGEGGCRLRVPIPGTLDALIDRHQKFLNRLGPGGLSVPPPLSCFRTVGYRREGAPAGWPCVAFSLLKPDASGFRPFDSVRRGLTLVGMVRNAVRRTAEQSGKPESWIASFVLGHGEGREADSHRPVGPRRFAFMPLPSIEARRQGKARVVGAIRRVLIATFAEGCEAEITWARRNLAGVDLIPEDGSEGEALLSLIPASDTMVRQYTDSATSWATITPVVLPGFDDPAHYRRRLRQGVEAEEQKRLLAGLEDRVDGLLRKAITQAGFPEVLASNAEIEWRKGGFLPGVEWADRYGVPDHLARFPRYHVSIVWRDSAGDPVEVPGPVCLGGGRYLGLGLFVQAPHAVLQR